MKMEFTTQPATSYLKALEAAQAANDKKGQDIIMLDMKDLLSLIDVFVITSGSNTRQVRSIVEEIKERIFKKVNMKPLSIEGLHDAGWVLMDYGDVVVHVFLEQVRNYYELERLWANAPRLTPKLDTDSSGRNPTPISSGLT